jgi:hypothetical protein
MALPDLEDFRIVNETWGKYCYRLSFFVNKKFLNESSPDWDSYTAYGEVVAVKLATHPEGNTTHHVYYY